MRSALANVLDKLPANLRADPDSQEAPGDQPTRPVVAGPSGQPLRHEVVGLQGL
ncbi:MAG: hypothetical protein MZW92_02115 [Comamonadaceae bacterium]|nr:hypothetical protein [Comamonadaceae bacterium]